jgi:hypothetical protein
LEDALLSPFPAVAVPVHLTALFSQDPRLGPLLRCLIHVDASALTFSNQADGFATARLEATAAAMTGEGRIVEQAGGRYDLRLSPAGVNTARHWGLVLTMDLTLKPGPYHLRIALRDTASGSIGSGYRFVEIPDLATGGLALSSIVISNADARLREDGAIEIAASPATGVTGSDTMPAVRRFRQGSAVAYAFTVYNAPRHPTTGQPPWRYSSTSTAREPWFKRSILRISRRRPAQFRSPCCWEVRCGWVR